MTRWHLQFWLQQVWNLQRKISAQTDAFVKELSRGEIIQKSLDNYGHILVAETMEDAIDAANSIASEHLEIVTANPFEVMTKIRNAGAISSENIPVSRSEIILQDRIMSFRRMEQRNSSHRYLLMILSRNQALFLTQEMHLRKSIQISRNLQRQNI